MAYIIYYIVCINIYICINLLSFLYYIYIYFIVSYTTIDEKALSSFVVVPILRFGKYSSV